MSSSRAFVATNDSRADSRWNFRYCFSVNSPSRSVKTVFPPRQAQTHKLFSPLEERRRGEERFNDSRFLCPGSEAARHPKENPAFHFHVSSISSRAPENRDGARDTANSGHVPDEHLENSIFNVHRQLSPRRARRTHAYDGYERPLKPRWPSRGSEKRAASGAK